MKLNRIGNKLGLAGAIGAILAVGMIANQMVAERAVHRANEQAERSRRVVESVLSASINMQQADHFTKESEIRSPSTLFVFIDTDADEITDPTFGVIAMGEYFQNYWLDIPADRHNSRSANLTFADGHVETWKWKERKGGRLAGSATINQEDLEDLRRLQQCIKGAGGN